MRPPFWTKSRTLWIWTAAGVALVPIGLSQPLFHPWTLVAVLWLAEPSSVRVAPSEEDAHRQNEQALRDLRQMAQRLGSLTSDAEALARIGPAALTLARAEGFDAHALSLSLRLDRRSGKSDSG